MTEPGQKLTAKQRREIREEQRRKAVETNGAAAVEAGEARSRAIADTNIQATLDPGAVSSVHGDVAKPQSSGGKVVVGCKIGVSYIDLQLQKPEQVDQQTMTGIRTVTEYRRVGQVVRIRGTAYPRGTLPDGFPDKPLIIAGAAMNFGIDADFWAAWKEQNRLNPIVRNGMIFAASDADRAGAIATETKDLLSGLEPVNPKGDPRSPKSTRTDVSNVETEEARAAKMKRAGMEA